RLAPWQTRHGTGRPSRRHAQAARSSGAPCPRLHFGLPSSSRPVRRLSETSLLVARPGLLPRSGDQAAEEGSEDRACAGANAASRESASDCADANPQGAGLLRTDGRTIMKRTDVTYGQLDQVLHSLGFSCRLKQGDPTVRVYEHKDSGAYISMPPFPE